MGFLSGALQGLSTLPCTFLPELQRHKDTVRLAFTRKGGPAISIKITDANLDSEFSINTLFTMTPDCKKANPRNMKHKDMKHKGQYSKKGKK